jgi:hypothetical protein
MPAAGSPRGRSGVDGILTPAPERGDTYDAGVFSYNCALHPNMKGSVEVRK